MNSKLREALENSNGLLEELACIGEWYESAMEQIRENNAALVAESEPIGNAAARNDDWLNQLVSLINGEINHYMSQGVDYFSVDCGPWHIHYDNTKGGAE